MKKIFLELFLNTGIQIFGKSISVFLGLITVLILTHYLGVDGYGKYILVFAYLSIFGSFGDFGLHLALVKELTQNKKQSKILIGTYFWMRVFFSLIAVFTSLIVLLFVPYSAEIKYGVIVATIGMGFGLISSFGNAIFQSKLRIDLITLVEIINKLITVLLIWIFVLLKANLNMILSAIFFGNISGLLLSLILLYRSGELHTSFNYNIFILILKRAAPIGLLSFASLLYFKIDSIILSLYKSTFDVGLYGVAYKIFENILVIWGYYMTSLFPVISKVAIEFDVNKFNRFVNKNIISIMIYSLALITVLFFVSTPLIKIVAGKDFLSSILPLKILNLSLPFFFINNLYYHIAIARNYTWRLLHIILISLVVNVILNLLFIPIYSYIGASVVTLITEVITFIGYRYIFLKSYEK